MKGSKWLMVVFAGLLVGAGAAVIVDKYSFGNNGGILTYGVTVTDLNGNPVTALDWGKVENGTAYVWEPLNVTSTSDGNVTLTLTTVNYTPSIISLGLTWNYTGAVLMPGESVIVELEQTITATGDWSYTTVITAESV